MTDTTHHETHGILNSTLTRSVLVLRRRAGFSCGSARLTVSYRFSLTFHVHLTEGKEGMSIYTLVHTSCLRDSPRPAWIPITLNSCSSLPTHPIIVLLSSTLCRYFTLHRLNKLGEIHDYSAWEAQYSKYGRVGSVTLDFWSIMNRKSLNRQ